MTSSVEIPVQAKFLCVEDEPAWQQKVRHALNTDSEIAVDCVDSATKAGRLLQKTRYEVCLLDSRLKDRKPAIHYLIVRAKRSQEAPVLVALTAYSGDISAEDRRSLFRVLEKEQVVADPQVLEYVLMDALHESVRLQATKLWGKLQPLPVPEGDSRLIRDLREGAAHAAPELCDAVKDVKRKYRLWQKRERRLPRTLLDCVGHVSAIRDQHVEVVMETQDGEEMRRVFDGRRFAAAGLHYQDAPFRYTIKRRGADVVSHIEGIEAEDDSPREWLDSLDFSVFEGFEPDE